MNKPLRHLENGSYQPISSRPLNLPPTVGIKEAAARQVRSVLSNVGCATISALDEQAAEEALARLKSRSDICQERWSDDVARDYADVRD